MITTTNLVLFIGVNFIVVEASDTGPIGPVTVYEVQDCDPALDELNFELTLLQDVDQKDKITLSFSLPFDIGVDATVSVDADKFDGSDWQKSAFVVENKPAFKFLNDFVSPIWNNFREQAVPKIEKPSEMLAGDYNVELFYAHYMDINTPQVPYGRFMASVYLTVDDVDVVCKKLEVEFTPPDSM